MFVATLGSSGAAKPGMEATQAAQFHQLCEDLNTIMDIKAKQELQGDVRDAVMNFATYNYDAIKAEDITRMSAELVAIFDPTGTAGVVAYVLSIFEFLSAEGLVGYLVPVLHVHPKLTNFLLATSWCLVLL